MYENCGEKKEGLPTLDDYNTLQHRLESAYICGEASGVTFYHTKYESRCKDVMDPHFYKHKCTKEICSV